MRLALYFTSASLAFCQTVRTPAFEVASVKRAAPAPLANGMTSVRGGPGEDDPEHVTYTNISLMNVLLRAYYPTDVFQVAGPRWLDDDRFDISAKLPPGTSRLDFRVMLQNLLAERFHLAVHRESRDLQGYELVVGKSGAKLKDGAVLKSGADGFPQLDRPGMTMFGTMGPHGPVARLTARSQPLSRLVDMLQGELRGPVLDRTGLTGKYDFNLEYAQGGPVLATADDLLLGMAAAVQEQLGLRLEPKKVPVDMLVVDRADRIPTENE